MLARFSLRAARQLIDAQIDQTGCSAQPDDEESSLVVDLYALRSLLFPIPENPWYRVASVCGQALPLCASIQKTLSRDFYNVAGLLLDLELRHADPENPSHVLPVGLFNEDPPTTLTPAAGSDHTTREHPPKKGRKGFHSRSIVPLVILSPHPSAPSIVITLSPSQPRDASCLVPYQDYAFGHGLTVPRHPVFNKIHPPMVCDSRTLPHRNGWKWDDGHWTAVLPTLAEQAKKGIFSSPIPSRRKVYRSYHAHPNR